MNENNNYSENIITGLARNQTDRNIDYLIKNTFIMKWNLIMDNLYSLADRLRRNIQWRMRTRSLWFWSCTYATFICTAKELLMIK